MQTCKQTQDGAVGPLHCSPTVYIIIIIILPLPHAQYLFSYLLDLQ